MLNVIALSLVVTSLAAAGVFGPAPQTNLKHPQLESTIIKQGHRVVVIEYDEDGHQNTKISISPEQTQYENLKEAGSAPPNDASFLHAPKNLISDAFGKCKEKISGAMGKAKESVSQGSHDDTSFTQAPKKSETTQEVGDDIGKAKEAAASVTPNDASFLHAPRDFICDADGKCKEKISGAMGKANDKVSEAAQEAVTNKARDIQEGAKECARDIARNVSREEAREAVKNIVHYLGSLVILGSTMNVVHLLGFASAYGLCVWVTFVSSYVLSRVIPREQLGVVQSKIYPVYFRAMAYSIGLALLGHILSHGIKRGFFGKAETFQAYNLLSSLVNVLVNSIYLEPRATTVMLERMKVEKEEGRGREDIARGERLNSTAHPTESATIEEDAVRSQIFRLNHKLRTLNSYSSFLNILTLMSLTWHLVYLAQLVHSCS